MAHARISAKLPPDIDPTKAPIAFGARALPKLNEELQSPELLTRQRALMALCDLVHDPENVYQAIKLGFLDNLKYLLLDQDSTVREKTTEVLYIMATHNVGRDGFIENGVIPALSQLLNDPVDICRRNMHRAFEIMAELPAGAVGIVESSLISSLVLKLKTELDEIQELILDTLSGCLCVEAFEALATGAVPILKEKLTHPSVAIRSKAARALLGISIPLEGKNIVWDEEVIPVLVSLLEDSDPEVRANAAGALMNATTTTQGKYAALSADAIPPLLKLVDDETSKVRLNAIKALTMLSEAPEGRKTLLNHVDLFRGQLNDSSEAVSRAAKIAIKVIEWKP
ncbi:radial spoke head 14 homolog [Terrapene carolina triunguis]|uniref:radial spoke head 14 homolog n=1 Tax=Terrapene triunguis TaxID=2587831 RepID=UPI000CEF93A8|nr:radial spoke head 14 homolog [Terrapene carolina triunguis]